MNSLLTKNLRTSVNTTTGITLCAAAFVAVFSSSVFANRPAMEGQSEMASEPETRPQASQPAPRPRPVTEGPSAVEVMMQQQPQQNRQTGDVVQLPATEMQPGETLKIQLLDHPRRGTSMDKVQQEFGQPMATSESIGQPPITHWTYSDRVVYFEYSTVLHVVAR